MGTVFFKPRRGKRTTAVSQNIILKNGEIFFEVPEDGAGAGKGRIKMGDGETPYTDLPYFLDPEGTTLTQEEFNALSPEEQRNGLYFITDDSSAEIDPEVTGAIIETTEKVLNRSKDGGLVINEIRGKTEQKTYTGKNLLDCSGLTETTINEVTFTPVYDVNGCLEYINVNGTASADTRLYIANSTELPAGSYIFSGCPSGGANGTYCIGAYCWVDDVQKWNLDIGNSITFTASTSLVVGDRGGTSPCILIASGTVCNNIKFYPMLRLADTDTVYEPYVGGKPSPNPSYPQEIKSVKGKNLLDCRGLVEVTNNDVTFTPEYDDNGNLKYINVNGTASANAIIQLRTEAIDNNTYIFSGCPSGGSTSSYRMTYTEWDENWNWLAVSTDIGGGTLLTHKDNVGNASFKIEIASGTVCDNLKFYPMIRLASITNNNYVPYGLLRIKTHGKNLLNDSNMTTWYKPDDSNVYRKIFKLKPNTEYTISQTKNSHEGLSLIFVISGKNLDFSPNTNDHGCTVGNSRTIRSDANGYITVGLYEAGKGCCQLEEGDVSTEYHSYNEIKITSSKPIELNGFDNLYDTITSENITRRIGVDVFDGSDDEGWTTWETSDSNLKRMYCPILCGVIKPTDGTEQVPENLLCNQFTVVSRGATYQLTNGISVNGDGGIIIYSEDFNSDVDAWKQHLATNPMVVVYELLEEVIEELPLSDKIALNTLRTFDDITYITIDTDIIEPEVEVKYGSNKTSALALENSNINANQNTKLSGLIFKPISKSEFEALEPENKPDNVLYLVFED